MKNEKLVFCFLFLLTALLATAQKTPMKFGKIEKADLEMTTYEADPEAAAVILCDYGHTDFKFDTNGDRGFYMVYQREVRVKILKEGGMGWADWKVLLYKNDRDAEKISGIKGFTYNLENGNVVKEKLASDQVFKNDYNDNWREVKFAMPKVKPGSVIDVKYMITSDFTFNLRSWQFQHKIPVVWSEYKTEIPEYYHYNKSLKGYEFHRLTIQEENQKNDRVTFRGFTRGEGLNTRSRPYSETLNYQKNSYRWVVENIPAFKTEGHMTTADNYLTALIFELSYIKIPGQPIDVVTKEWKGINRLLNEEQRFGQQLKKIKFLKEEVKNFKSQYPDPADRVAAIYAFVQKNMKWNGKNEILVTKSLEQAFKKGQGNSADINLLLTAIMKHADLDAAPVTLSTRKHGLLNPVYPSVSQFNYVVAGVKLGEEYLLLDATDKKRPGHMLPFKCLNGQGRWIDQGEGYWVKLLPGGSYKQAIMGEMKVDASGNFKGKLSYMLKDYAALDARKKLERENQEAYSEDLRETYDGLSVEETALESMDEIGKGIKETYTAQVEEQSMVSGDFIYFSPMLCFGETENPFKLEERQYPIDFGYPIDHTISMRFTIPEGYLVDELPEKAVVALPNKGGKFTYHVVQTPTEIMINSKCSIKQAFFLSEDYIGLKEFFNLMIEKHAEQVVLKKKT
ncbi:MAG: transglutaminase domain-containing protein [Bacteroidota bacterium]